MANESTYTLSSGIIANIYQAALLQARETGIMNQLVTTWTDMTGLAPRIIGTYAGGTVQAITEATDMSAQTFSGSANGTITPSLIGAQYFINDTLRDSDPNRIVADAGRDLGNIIGQKIDTDLITLGTGISGSVGSAGGTLTWTNFMLAAAKLRTNLAPAPWVAVLHPMQWYYMTAVGSIPTLMQDAPEWLNAMSRQYFVGQWGGISIFVDANVPTPSNCGVMFNAAAFVADIRRGFGIETQRDASRGGGGWELNATYGWGKSIYRDAFAIKLMGTCA